MQSILNLERLAAALRIQAHAAEHGSDASYKAATLAVRDAQAAIDAEQPGVPAASRKLPRKVSAKRVA